MSITGIASTKDQTVQATVVPRAFAASGDPWVGMFARYQSAGNYYYATVRGSSSISLRKVVGGAVQVLDTAALPVSLGTLYALRLEAIGSQLRVYVNNRHVLDATDSTFQTGRYGLATFRAAAEFDDVLVTQP